MDMAECAVAARVIDQRDGGGEARSGADDCVNGACAVEQQRGCEDEMSAMDVRAVGLAAHTQTHRRLIRANRAASNRSHCSHHSATHCACWFSASESHALSVQLVPV